MTHKVLIGIGSNLGSPQENCKKAISLLDELESISILKQSSFYQSEPIGKKNQPWFVNAAIEIQTTLSPESLLKTLLNIEQQMGRTRSEKWGPRVIDLDILDYEGRMINSKSLTLPHPEMLNRRFVLEPLSEISGSTINPVKNKSIKTLLNELSPIPVVIKLSGS